VLREGLSTAIAAAKLGAVASHPRRVVDRATRGRHTSLEPSAAAAARRSSSRSPQPRIVAGSQPQNRARSSFASFDRLDKRFSDGAAAPASRLHGQPFVQPIKTRELEPRALLGLGFRFCGILRFIALLCARARARAPTATQSAGSQHRNETLIPERGALQVLIGWPNGLLRSKPEV
jgi:hypothetical protein